RVLGGLLRTRVQGAARRGVVHRRRRDAGHVPQLGLPDPPPDLRRLPLRARRLMCRHLAYVGPPIAVSEPLLDASHALVRQAQNPQYQLSGDDNPDGFGVVWYEKGTPHPWRYRTTMPMWLQPGLANAFVGVHARALVAAARLAS